MADRSKICRSGNLKVGQTAMALVLPSNVAETVERVYQKNFSQGVQLLKQGRDQRKKGNSFGSN